MALSGEGLRDWGYTENESQLKDPRGNGGHHPWSQGPQSPLPVSLRQGV